MSASELEAQVARFAQNEERINKWVNGGPTETYKTSEGVDVATIRNINDQVAYLPVQFDTKLLAKADIIYVDGALSNLSTLASKFYPTLAEANSDIANIAINQPVQVGESGVNGGLYYKADAGSTSLTKSSYDPLTNFTNLLNQYSSPTNIENLYDAGLDKNGWNINHVNGSLRASTTVAICVIPVVAGKTYYIKSPTWNEYFAGSYSSDNTLTNGKLQQLAVFTATADPLVKTVTVPVGMKYLYLNTWWATTKLDVRSSLVVSGMGIETVVKKVNGYDVADVTGRKIVQSLLDSGPVVESDIGVSTVNLAPPESFLAEKYVNRIALAISTYPGSAMAMFPVEEGKTYYVKAHQFLTNSCVGFRADNSSGAGTTLDIKLLGAVESGIMSFTVPSGAGYKYAYYTVALPSQSYDVSSTVVIADSKSGIYATHIKGIPIGYGLSEDLGGRVKELEDKVRSINSVSPLIGLKWAVIGDSITEKNFRTNKNYHDYVSEMVGGMTVLNYGASGHTWGNRSGVPNTIPLDVDIVTVFLGTNDFGIGARTFGTFLDGQGTATVCGSIQLLLTNLTNRFFNKTLAVLMPLPRYNSYGENGADNSFGYTLKDVRDMIELNCKHFGLPFLDLYNESNLFPYITEANSFYFTYPGGTNPDGVHPNDNGHHKIGVKVKNFLEYVYAPTSVPQT